MRPWLWRAALRFWAWPPCKLGPFLRWRFQTQYGSDHPGDPRDAVTFLSWSRSYDKVGREQQRQGRRFARRAMATSVGGTPPMTPSKKT